MSTTMAQFLYLSDVFGNPTEIINGARTARRLASASACGSGFSDVLENAGCDGLLLQPCTMAADGSTSEWQMMNVTPHAAPWYTGSQASLDGYGFYIEEWTGMDGAHHGRSSTGVGANTGGAFFGPQTHSHRVMKLNVLLVGESEAGLTHLFRWLEDTLMDCCSRCDDVSMWVREFCPTNAVANPEEGMSRLNRVVLLEGPTWEAPVTESSGCSVRRVSFTLGAGDPCLYATPESCAATTAITATAQALGPDGSISDVADDGSFVAAGDGITCSPDTEGGEVDFGVWAPRVTITSAIKFTSTGTRADLPDIRISGFSNPGATALGPTGTARKMGEIVISGRGGAGLEIVVDLAQRKVTYRDVTGSTYGGWVDGSRLIGRSLESSLRRWWAIRRCDYGVVSVEPVHKGLYNTSTAAAATQTAFSVAIDIVNRWGCC